MAKRIIPVYFSITFRPNTYIEGLHTRKNYLTPCIGSDFVVASCKLCSLAVLGAIYFHQTVKNVEMVFPAFLVGYCDVWFPVLRDQF